MGTSLSPSSRIWFAISHGILNEIYYPRIDLACTRDMAFVVTDGGSYFSEEKRHAASSVSYLSEGVLAYRLVNTCGQGRYRIEKEIITDPGIPKGGKRKCRADSRDRHRLLQRELSFGIVIMTTDTGSMKTARPIRRHRRRPALAASDGRARPLRTCRRQQGRGRKTDEGDGRVCQRRGDDP